MATTILGLATATPRRSIAQADAAELAKAYGCLTAEQVRLLPVLYRRTRVGRRGSVLLKSSDSANDNGDDALQRQSFYSPALAEADRGPTTRQRMERYEAEAAELALAAARAAMVESRVPASAITQIVVVSCTGFVAPGVDVALMKALGLNATTGRTSIGFMGCHGAMNGLRAANAYCTADPAARVLLVAVELCSLHYFYGWDPEKIVANALFADGAAALVLGAESSEQSEQGEDPHPGLLPKKGEGERWSIRASGSCVFPDSEDAMSWTIGDHGFEMTLSSHVPDLIAAHLRPWLESWLKSQGFARNDIASWAIHPGGPRIVSSVVEALSLPASAAEVSNQVLAECGNMSSPTILFILERLRKSAARRPCVAIGFGPGLAAEVALFV